MITFMLIHHNFLMSAPPTDTYIPGLASISVTPQVAITGELDSESFSDPGSDSSDEDLPLQHRYASNLHLLLNYLL